MDGNILPTVIGKYELLRNRRRGLDGACLLEVPRDLEEEHCTLYAKSVTFTIGRILMFVPIRGK